MWVVLRVCVRCALIGALAFVFLIERYRFIIIEMLEFVCVCFFRIEMFGCMFIIIDVMALFYMLTLIEMVGMCLYTSRCWRFLNAEGLAFTYNTLSDQQAIQWRSHIACETCCVRATTKQYIGVYNISCELTHQSRRWSCHIPCAVRTATCGYHNNSIAADAIAHGGTTQPRMATHTHPHNHAPIRTSVWYTHMTVRMAYARDGAVDPLAARVYGWYMQPSQTTIRSRRY